MTPLPDRKIKQLVSRLWDACEKQTWLDPDLWQRGLDKFEEKWGFRLVLDKCEPVGPGVGEGECPTQLVTITELYEVLTPVVCPDCGLVEVRHDNQTYCSNTQQMIPTSGFCPKCKRRLRWADAFGKPYQKVEVVK